MTERESLATGLAGITPYHAAYFAYDLTKRAASDSVERLTNALADAQVDLTSDLGFRVLKLAQSNVKEWDVGIEHDEEALKQQLAFRVDHLREGRSDLDFVFEVLLKGGYPLSAKIGDETIAGKRVYSISDGAFLICLERSLTLELVRAIAARELERVLFLDEGLAGNDQLKPNAVQTFKTKGTAFRTL